ncbi:hypothetical protein KDH_50140 [Dictyobacter sp. S3.2.2.5]|uniref:Uncharacterized protein n=1 Tax=Dictyobacter halimunensis TaxID=3026934 RepID=A0ABQ6FWU0_9CHLR|nr:hypothetical protein KDH_50140 [Dictyobacter sp. S3.2.2.5]
MFCHNAKIPAAIPTPRMARMTAIKARLRPVEGPPVLRSERCRGVLPRTAEALVKVLNQKLYWLV